MDVPIERIARRDHATVVSQRESRGTLVEWAFESFEGISDSARRMLYEHAHHYQDGLLDVIMSTYGDLGGQVPELAEHRGPELLRRRQRQELRRRAHGRRSAATWRSPSSLYRKKAIFVYKVGEQWDDITDRRAKAYMACRAAIAAKDDFDLTPEDKRPGTTEERRRGRDFFRVEATVGMD